MKIFRKRFIPNEIVDISGDEVLFFDEKQLITKWKPIKPREEMNSGISFTFLDKGYKISKFFKDENLLFWYCDIIDSKYKKDTNELIITDLLVDIKVFPDGSVRVLDIEEIAECLEQGIISAETCNDALRKLSTLLNMIYDNNFPPQVCKEY